MRTSSEILACRLHLQAATHWHASHTTWPGPASGILGSTPHICLSMRRYSSNANSCLTLMLSINSYSSTQHIKVKTRSLRRAHTVGVLRPEEQCVILLGAIEICPADIAREGFDALRSVKMFLVIFLMPFAFARRIRLASETKSCSSSCLISSRVNPEDGNERYGRRSSRAPKATHACSLSPTAVDKWPSHLVNSPFRSTTRGSGSDASRSRLQFP